MTIPLFLAVSLAGGLGAVARLIIDTAVTRWLGDRFPFGTVIINITGSFLLGVVVGIAGGASAGLGLMTQPFFDAHVNPSDFRLVFGTGLLGGYTTFSTASFDTVRLLRARRFIAAAFHGFGMLLVSVIAAALGLFLASTFA